jgi:hypothetical protein
VTANFRSNNVSVLLGNGDGTFQASRTFAVGEFPYSVAVADINGDGKPDLVTANFRSNDVSVLLGNGDGSFQAAKNFPVGTGPYSVAVADFNGDGKPDVVTANHFSNNVTVLLGNDTGTFPTFPVPPTLAVGSQVFSVALADVNGDGRPDLITANKYTNDVSVFLNNGDGTFQTAQNFAAGYGPVWVAVADVNGDGKPDLVVANQGTFDPNTGNFGPVGVSVLLGNGDGSFQPAKSFPVGQFPTEVLIADVNGDGKPDLVVTDPAGDAVSVLLGNGDGLRTAPSSMSCAVAGKQANFECSNSTVNP